MCAPCWINSSRLPPRSIFEGAHCNAPIRGHLRGAFGASSLAAKPYCHNCGKPFPWTERALAAAKLLASKGLLQKPDLFEVRSDQKDRSRDLPPVTDCLLVLDRAI
jgi:hypothetical protein